MGTGEREDGVRDAQVVDVRGHHATRLVVAAATVGSLAVFAATPTTTAGGVASCVWVACMLILIVRFALIAEHGGGEGLIVAAGFLFGLSFVINMIGTRSLAGPDPLVAVNWLLGR